MNDAVLEVPRHLDEIDDDEEPVAPKKAKQSREVVICALCEQKCHGIGGLKRHLNYCKLNPNSKNNLFYLMTIKKV